MSLEISNLSFAYDKNKQILEDISLKVEAGEILGILGPNGTGKTTFIKCVNRILIPQVGTVFCDNKDVSKLNAKEIAKLMAYVPQYNSDIFPMSVVDAVMMGRLPYVKHNYGDEDKELVFALLAKMDLEKFAFRNIQQMSGGERQRVFVARALAQQPRVIILDEPTSSLDLHNQLFILHLIAELAKAEKLSIVMTIHDLNLASMFCDKLLMLKDRRIFAYGETQSVLQAENIDEMYKVRTLVTVEDGFKHVRLLKKL